MYDMFKDDLNEYEQMGKYLFRVVQCAITEPGPVYKPSEHTGSPLRQKHIDLYDLMDVELRMIR